MWSMAENPDAVLPAGATLSVDSGSVIVTGDEATVDVVMAVPGQQEIRSWVFMRRMDSEWLVYGTLPLDTEP